MSIAFLPSAQLTASSPTVTLPAGWVKTTDVQSGSDALSRQSTYTGVATSADAAVAALRAAFDASTLALQDISVSRSPGSPTATVTCKYSVPTASGHTPDEDADIISPDTVALTPQLVPTALAAHPRYASIQAAIVALDDALARGLPADSLVAAAGDNALAREYLALRMAGVTTWDAAAWKYAYTRHYSDMLDITDLITAAQQAVCRVYGWSGVKGSDALPEPKWLKKTRNASGQEVTAATSYQWRFDGVQIAVANGEKTLTFNYSGVWAWASAIYAGGSWTPALPS